MKVDIVNIKKSLVQSKKKEDDYEGVYYTYYNKIENVDDFWKNNIEEELLKNIFKEKKEMNIIYNSLTDINDIYSFICDKYSFAKSIMVDFSSENNIVNSIDNCINRLSKIIRMFNYVDRSELTDYQLHTLNNISYGVRQLLDNKLLVLRDNLNSNFGKIKKIENEIQTQIAKVSIYDVTETPILGNMVDDDALRERFILASEPLENIVKLLNSQIDEEEGIIKTIIECYDSFMKNYVSDNNKLLEKLTNNIILNLKTNKSNHDYNVYLINQRIDEVNKRVAEAKKHDDSSHSEGMV